jgi:hypothetical protein
MPVTSRTSAKYLKPIFDTPDSELGPLIARLTVLYEDLRIELYGATDDSIPHLDGNTTRYRKFYFLRRSTVTLVEFRGALHRLNECPEFQELRKRFDEEQEKRWVDANAFFGKHHAHLKAVRNHCGGHFPLSTTIKAVRETHPDTVGSMEIDFGKDGEHVRVYFKFALEFVGPAIVAEKKPGEDLESYAHRLFDVLWEAWLHVVKVMHAIAKATLVPRFGL